MKKFLTGPLLGVCALALAASVAACGGGGGGSSGGGGGGGGTPPTNPPTSNPSGNPSPTSSPTQSATGTLAIQGVDLNDAKVTFTCGCDQNAGLIQTNASGQYTITGTAPLAPTGGTSPSYTLSGHNVLVIGYATNSATQAWTMQYVGKSPATNLSLNASDTAAAAAALYLYYEVDHASIITGSSDKTFDWFNFNQVVTWVSQLRSTPNSAEAQLMSDITAAQNAGTSLFPYSQPWNPTSDGTNPTISTDLSAVASSGDATMPTPCPGTGPNNCTGTPQP